MINPHPDYIQLQKGLDPLEELGRIVDFEAFRPILENALGYSDGTKGGRARARHAPGMAALSPPMIRWRCSKY